MIHLRRCLYIWFHIPPIEGGALFKIAPPPRSPYIQSPAAARFKTAPPPKLSSYIQLPGAAPAIKKINRVINQKLLSPQKLAEKSSHQKLNSFILLFHCSIRIYIKIACWININSIKVDLWIKDLIDFSSVFLHLIYKVFIRCFKIFNLQWRKTVRTLSQNWMFP